MVRITIVSTCLLKFLVLNVSFLSQVTFGTNISAHDLLPFTKSNFVLPNSDQVTIVSRITPNFKSIDFDSASETIVFECQYTFDTEDDEDLDESSADSDAQSDPNINWFSDSVKRSNSNQQIAKTHLDPTDELDIESTASATTSHGRLSTTSNSDDVTNNMHAILKIAPIPNKKLNHLIQNEFSILHVAYESQHPDFVLVPYSVSGACLEISLAEHTVVSQHESSIDESDDLRSQSDKSVFLGATFDFSFLKDNEANYEYEIDTDCIRYFFQEYVSGSTTLINDCTGDRKTDANPRDRIPLCEGLLNYVGIGMKHIYDETGFVHRDLSWNNIMVARNEIEDTDQVEITFKVIDWGGAAPVHTEQNGMPGTPGFLAPIFKVWHKFNNKTHQKKALETEKDKNGDKMISQKLIDRNPVLTHPVQDIWALLINVLFVLKEDPYIIHSGYFRANDTNNTMLPCIQDEWWQCEQSLKKFPNVQRRLEKNPFILQKFGSLSPNLANITTNAFASVSPLLPESVVETSSSPKDSVSGSSAKNDDANNAEQDADDIDQEVAQGLSTLSDSVREQSSFRKSRSPYFEDGEYAHAKVMLTELLGQTQLSSSLKAEESLDVSSPQYGESANKHATQDLSNPDGNAHTKKFVPFTAVEQQNLQRSFGGSFGGSFAVGDTSDSRASFKYPNDMTIDDIHLQIQKDYVVQVESILQFVVDLMKKILANPTSVDWNIYALDLQQHNVRTASGSMTALSTSTTPATNSMKSVSPEN